MSPRRLDHAAAFLDFQRHVLVRRMLGGQIVAEGSPGVPPCLDGEPMSPDARRREAGLPTVIHHQAHGDAVPLRYVVRTPQQCGGQHIMAIRDDVGVDQDAFSHQTFDGKRAIGNLRLNCLDGESCDGEPRWLELNVAHGGMDDGPSRSIDQCADLAGCDLGAVRVLCQGKG